MSDVSDQNGDEWYLEILAEDCMVARLRYGRRIVRVHGRHARLLRAMAKAFETDAGSEPEDRGFRSRAELASAYYTREERKNGASNPEPSAIPGYLCQTFGLIEKALPGLAGKLIERQRGRGARLLRRITIREMWRHHDDDNDDGAAPSHAGALRGDSRPAPLTAETV